MRNAVGSLGSAALIVVTLALDACSSGTGEAPKGGGEAPIAAPAGERARSAEPPTAPAAPAASPSASAPATSLGATDPEELNDRFDHPTGRATAANVEAVMTRVQLIPLQFPDLANVLGPKSCTESAKDDAACPCPDGGTAHLKPTTSAAATDRGTLFTYASCKTGRSTLDGETYLHVRKTADGSTVVRQLAIFKITRMTDGQNSRAELDVAFRHGKPGALGEFAFTVDDGVLVAAPDSSGIVIRDRFGSWACSGTARTGTCTFRGSDPSPALDN